VTQNPTYEELEKRIQELEQSESDRNRVEKLLRLHAEITSNMTEGVYLIDLENAKIRFTNPKFEHMFGYGPGEMLGKNVSIVNAPTDKAPEETAREIMEELYNTGEWHGEVNNIKKDGTTFWCRANISVFDHHQYGKVLVSVHSDITNRRRAEEALKYSNLRLEAILNNLDSSIYITDMDSHEILFMNNHMKELFGKDLISKICWKSFHKNQEGPYEFCTNDKLIDADKNLTEPYVWEIYNQKLKKWYQLRDQAIPWIDGRLVRMEMALDITDRKNMETQLQQAQKMESIGILAGGIAHDFNNLLFAVMGNISLAQDDLKPESEASESLRAAEDACVKAKELTARLITFSKGGDPIKKINSIDELLKETVASALQGSNIKPEISIANDIRQANIDEDQIKQVVRNIVVNAKEAMDGNGPLKVSCENIEISEKNSLTLNPGKYIKIFFEDQGYGISKENMGKIFDPYFSTKDMGADKGQGLGLTISYSIIEKHGGLITVESELRKGSTVSVYLPAASAKEPGLQKSKGKPVAQKPVKQSGTGTGKILLMDDEKEIRAFLGQVINRLGYDVETCTEGKEAVEIYKKAMESKKTFDVAILDLTNKVGMGGQETMRRLLEIDDTARGIVITGYFDNPVVANFRAYGFSGFITKPATRDQLSKVINEVISKDQ